MPGIRKRSWKATKTLSGATARGVPQCSQGAADCGTRAFPRLFFIMVFSSRWGCFRYVERCTVGSASDWTCNSGAWRKRPQRGAVDASAVPRSGQLVSAAQQLTLKGSQCPPHARISPSAAHLRASRRFATATELSCLSARKFEALVSDSTSGEYPPRLFQELLLTPAAPGYLGARLKARCRPGSAGAQIPCERSA